MLTLPERPQQILRRTRNVRGTTHDARPIPVTITITFPAIAFTFVFSILVFARRMRLGEGGLRRGEHLGRGGFGARAGLGRGGDEGRRLVVARMRAGGGCVREGSGRGIFEGAKRDLKLESVRGISENVHAKSQDRRLTCGEECGVGVVLRSGM